MGMKMSNIFKNFIEVVVEKSKTTMLMNENFIASIISSDSKENKEMNVQ